MRKQSEVRGGSGCGGGHKPGCLALKGVLTYLLDIFSHFRALAFCDWNFLN